MEHCGRPEYNGNIVDELWSKIQAPELQGYVTALKVDHGRNPRDYKDILSDFAGEVANQKVQTTLLIGRNISVMESGSNESTREGKCPTNGVHQQDGKLFIGSYSKEKWHSNEVKPYQKQILEARQAEGRSHRGSGGFHKSRKEKRRVQEIKWNKKKIKSLEASISELKSAPSKVAAVQFQDQTVGS